MSDFPPTPSSLKAMAGWALSVRDNSSAAQAVALNKFRDGCSDLAENYPRHCATPSGAPGRTGSAASSSRDRGIFFLQPKTRRELPEAVAEGLVTCSDGGSHRFSIKTQRCYYCNKTYREAMSRQPELM